MRCQILLLLLSSVATSIAAPSPLHPSFRAVNVDTNIGIGYGLAAADVNGDGKPDLVLADKDQFVWYQNPGWQKHVITGKLTPKDHVCLAARDIDGDGKCELAVGAEWNPGDTENSGAVFYLIPPADRTQKWEPVKLRHEPTVHRMRWVRNAAGNYDLVMLPLHGRGNKAATGEGDGVKALIYKVPSDPKQPWTVEPLPTSLHKTHNLDPVQWDDDSAEEILICSKEGVYLLDRAESGAKLTRLTGAEIGGAGEIRTGRLPGGRRYLATIEPMHGNSVVTYTAPGSAAAGQLWQRNVIDESIIDGHAVACGDVLKAGHDQLVVGWRAMSRPANARVGIKLYAPLDPDGKMWRETLIDDNGMACEDLVLADLDGDGDLDIAAAGRATKNVKVYFNETTK
jgi:hypothetical protein